MTRMTTRMSAPPSCARTSMPSATHRWRSLPTTRDRAACAPTGCCPTRSSTSTASSAWPRGCDGLDDLLAEGDITHRIFGGGPWLAVFGEAFVELDQLALERRLEGHRL